MLNIQHSSKDNKGYMYIGYICNFGTVSRYFKQILKLSIVIAYLFIGWNFFKLIHCTCQQL